MECPYKSNANWTLSLTRWQWLERPAKEKKPGVNYYFKSSCEINETLGAPRWFKRSPPAFNRLFNHTRAGSQCGFVLFSRLPAFRERRPQTRAGFPLNIIWASAHQKAPITHLELSLEGGGERRMAGLLSTFFFVSSWSPSVWDYAAQVFSVRSVSSEVSAEGKQDFTPAVTLSLYWSQRIYIFQLFLFFPPRILWGGLTLMLTQCVCLEV